MGGLYVNSGVVLNHHNGMYGDLDVDLGLLYAVFIMVEVANFLKTG